MSDCVECGGLLTGRQKKYDSAKCAKRAGRRAWVLKTYNITLEEYDIVFAYQGERCPICRRKPRADEVFPIDHEHGAHVRGIPCKNCNWNIIRKLKDPEMAQRLADYLQHPPAVAALGRHVVAPGRPRKKRQRVVK